MTAWDIAAYLSLAIVALGLLASLIGTGPDYVLPDGIDEPLDSERFRWMLEALTDAPLNPNTDAEVLTNGENFYPAQIAAIRGAQRSINLEAYIFSKGRVSSEMVAAMAERARDGVKVNVVIDWVGSLSTRKSYFKDLLAAGGKVEKYHPIGFKSFFRLNNRTHRELLIVDGNCGFIGGAGINDQWRFDEGKRKRWRDTCLRVRGDAVSNLQATFAENWCECTGEILVGDAYWPGDEDAGTTCGMVINGSPNASQFTRARILFQALIAAARHSICITTPYFLPDSSMIGELVRAVRERNVLVRILVPGDKSDHLLTRTSSRLLYGEVLKAGAEIYEYQPAMIHAKILIVDDLWSVVGSTNCDSRSFGLNDEVNLALIGSGPALRLKQDFANDLKQSKRVSYEQWNKRGIRERVVELLGWVLRKQQ